MADPVKAQREKTSKLRSRVISHHKKGKRAPRLEKAYQRAKVELARRIRRKRQRQAELGPQQALRWAQARVGITENPWGSNRNPKNITSWQRTIAGGGEWLVGQPWCGVFVGMALRAAGIQPSSRIAAVAFIEDDARAGRNGFERLVALSEARPGDAVCLFGRGVHVELIESVDHKRRVLSTYGGNTSFGNGSQSNGGCVAHRAGGSARPFGVVHCVARPAYPRRSA